MTEFSREDIEKQLERILDSEGFRNSSRLSGFLKYVVQKACEEDQSNITGYQIGVDVFEKGENFDADNDSSVRVEAVRLRKALDLYYHGEGKNDPIVIKMPKGRYVPFFFENNLENSAIQSLNRKTIFAALTALVLIFCIAFFIQYRFFSDSKTQNLEKPVLALEPFSILGFSDPDTVKSKAAYLFNNRLSYFSSLQNIVIEDKENLDSLRGNNTNERFHYLLSGTIEQKEKNISLKIRLFDTRNRTTAWSHQKTYTPNDKEYDYWLEDASSLIVSRLASTHGIIDTLEYNKYKGKNAANAGQYECLLAYRIYENHKSAERHAQVRECLEELVKKMPDQSVAWGYLSWIYGDEIRHGFNPRSDKNKDTRKQSLDAAMMAVKSDQKDARSHMYLASAAMLNGDTDLALRHANVSLSLNPYNTEILIQAATKLVHAGKLKEGLEYAERAYRLHPSPPPAFDATLFCYYYLLGDYDRALLHALGYFQPDLFVSYVTLIMAYIHTDQSEKAKELADIANKKYPDQIANFHDILQGWNLYENFKNNIIIDAKAAGLNIPEK